MTLSNTINKQGVKTLVWGFWVAISPIIPSTLHCGHGHCWPGWPVILISDGCRVRNCGYRGQWRTWLFTNKICLSLKMSVWNPDFLAWFNQCMAQLFYNIYIYDKLFCYDSLWCHHKLLNVLRITGSLNTSSPPSASLSFPSFSFSSSFLCLLLYTMKLTMTQVSLASVRMPNTVEPTERGKGK